ncbi:AMP-binding protein [Sphingomonas oryzagri]
MSLAAAERARTTADAMAVVDDRQELSWAALDPILNRGTNALLAFPFAPTRRIAVFAHNAVETLLAYLCGLHAGVSSVPANFHLTPPELAYILKDSDAEILFVGPETAAVGLAAAKEAGVGKVVGWRCPPTEGLQSWDDWLVSASADEPPTDMPPRPYLHYTSGTTGRPKGTETPPNMLPQAPDVAGLFAALRQAVEEGPGGAGIVVGPLYHTGPLGAARQLGGGKPQVVLSRFDAEALLAAIERWKVGTSVMVPTHFQRLLALPEAVRARYDVSSLTGVAHTGAACPPEVKRAMIAWFGPVLSEAYGGTESGTTNLITSEEWLAKPGSVGRAVLPFEVVVIADDGTRLGTGEAGQLYFRDTNGRGVIYHKDPEKTASAHIEPGVFTLGDVGYVDADGYVFITDRVSDMIVSGGVNIYPAEVEQVLIEHPDIEDVAVIGVPNKDMGEEVKALVVLRDGHQPATADLAGFCRERLAGYKCPRTYDFVPDVGRNAMGKVNKRELRKPYWPSDRTIGG